MFHDRDPIDRIEYHLRRKFSSNIFQMSKKSCTDKYFNACAQTVGTWGFICLFGVTNITSSATYM